MVYHEACALCGDYAVEEHFCHQHFRGRDCDFAWVVDSVSPYGEPRLIGFCLFWSDCAHKLPVSDIFHPFCWYFVLEYKLNSVGGIFILPPMLFANCPNLMANVRLHACLYFVLLINCL
jgi:hypothetical protein